MNSVKIAVEIALALSVVVFVHELGHFIIAKLRGVKVLIFSIGFGPKIMGFKKGDTDYILSAIPMGGYVKMAGDEFGENRKLEKWEFFGQSWWSKILIVTCGPVMNVIFTFLLFILLFMQGERIPTFSTLIGKVEKGSIAEKVGIKPMDRIVAVDGKEISNWNKFVDSVYRKNKFIIKIARGEIQIEKEVNLPKDTNIGLYPYQAPVIGMVGPVGPAYKAGLKPDDVIVKINDKEITQWIEISEIISTNAEKELKFVIRRGPELFEKIIKPVKDPLKERESGIIGISAKTNHYEEVKYTFFESVGNSYAKILFLTKANMIGLYKIIIGKIPLKDSLGGPVIIIKLATDQAKKGLQELLNFFGFVSLMLGIFNFLPIPLVDGGYIVMFIIEGIRGKQWGVKAQTVFQYVGLAIIISLMVFATFNDILRIIR